MILPSKHISYQRCLLNIGARIIEEMSKPLTIYDLWECFREKEKKRGIPTSYNQFILTLDFLYSIGAINLRDGYLKRCGKDDSVCTSQ